MPVPTKRSEDGSVVFAVFALRSLGEGGPGTNFIEHYACRACPAFANQKRGYKVDRGLVTSQGIQIFIDVTGAVAVYTITNLSWV